MNVNNRCLKRYLATCAVYGVRWSSLLALGLLALYRAGISPLLCAMAGPACRFQPTCSVYATQAVARYGIVRGGCIALKRLMKCRPFGGWGFDPLPESDNANEVARAETLVCNKWNIVG